MEFAIRDVWRDTAKRLRGLESKYSCLHSSPIAAKAHNRARGCLHSNVIAFPKKRVDAFREHISEEVCNVIRKVMEKHGLLPEP